ncbi:hypothetical protein M758_8G101500 [Ceratodon purpureus]|nr:hypothetical protein M758_8G101500 [Ceratodon purpureus]
MPPCKMKTACYSLFPFLFLSHCFATNNDKATFLVYLNKRILHIQRSSMPTLDLNRQ